MGGKRTTSPPWSSTAGVRRDWRQSEIGRSGSAIARTGPTGRSTAHGPQRKRFDRTAIGQKAAVVNGPLRADCHGRPAVRCCHAQAACSAVITLFSWRSVAAPPWRVSHPKNICLLVCAHKYKLVGASNVLERIRMSTRILAFAKVRRPQSRCARASTSRIAIPQ